MSYNNRQSLLEQLEMRERDLIYATERLTDCEKYDDRGGIEHYEEQIRWAKMKIMNILEYLNHSKGA